MVGNDGHHYKSVANRQGVFVWKRIPNQKATTRKSKSKINIYTPLDNGGTPYLVSIDTKSRTLCVDAFVYNDEFEKDPTIPPKRIFQRSFSDVWIGDNVLKLNTKGMTNEKGNAIVMKDATKNNTFIYIGNSIKEFHLIKGDSVDAFQSQVGNNGVPYPYIIGHTHTYFLIENSAVLNTYLDFKKDAYGQLYGHIAGITGSPQNIQREFGIPLKMKTLHTPS